MYIATKLIETRFNKVFRKGDIVPDEIAEHYLRYVTKEEGELLVETPSEVIVEKEDIVEDIIDLEEQKEEKKSKKKSRK